MFIQETARGASRPVDSVYPFAAANRSRRRLRVVLQTLLVLGFFACLGMALILPGVMLMYSLLLGNTYQLSYEVIGSAFAFHMMASFAISLCVTLFFGWLMIPVTRKVVCVLMATASTGAFAFAFTRTDWVEASMNAAVFGVLTVMAFALSLIHI